MKLQTEQMIYGVLLTAGTIALLLFLWSKRQTTEPEVEPEVEVPVVEAEEEPTPRFPVGPAPEQSGEEEAELIPLPPLSDSDSYFAMELGDVFGQQLGELLVNEALIEKFVTTVDNLPRENVAERLRPVGKPPGQFAATETGNEERFTLSENNYDRYDALVDMFINTPTEQILDGYRRFYPLMQEAYRNLGYPEAYFNDRLVEVIDHLLATPDAGTSPELVRPHVLYEYADANLESLSSGQKLMIRIGPEHAAAVKSKLTELRAALVAGNEATTTD